MTQTEMHVDALDHLVLTVRDIQKSIAYYERVLGMQMEVFVATDNSHRYALKFGVQKINLHLAGAEFEPKADRPQPGSADLCFLSARSVDDWQSHLIACAVPVLEGPVLRTGATGPINSLYVRDPDLNLIEISVPVQSRGPGSA